MSRLLFVLALAACGKVQTNTPQDGPDGPADTADDAPPDVRIPVWSAYQQVNVNFAATPRNPSLTNDGLGIFFADLVNNGGSDNFDAFQASRTTAATGFGAALPIANVNVTGQQQRYVEISGDGLEIYYSDVSGQIHMATRANTNAAFSAPISAGTGIVGNFPSISGDKLSLYFIATVQSVQGEFRVATRAVVGQPFSNPVAVPLAGAVEIFSSIEISRDELFVVRAPPLTGTNNTPPTIARRASKNDPFVNTDEALPPIDFSVNPFVSARLSQNDTEIWISQHDGNNNERVFVSKLE